MAAVELSKSVTTRKTIVKASSWYYYFHGTFFVKPTAALLEALKKESRELRKFVFFDVSLRSKYKKNWHLHRQQAKRIS